MRLAQGVQRLMVATGKGPLRRAWLWVYEGLARAFARYLVHGDADATAYVRGSLAAGAPEPGLSDIDLVVIAQGLPGRPGAHRARLDGRWQRLCNLAPPVRALTSIVIAEEAPLADTARSTALTYGLARQSEASRAFYFGPGRPPDDDLGLSYRPGLYRTMGGLRVLRGHDRRPHLPPRTAQDERLAGWMEVQQCWRYVFKAETSDIGAPYRAYLLPKLAADLARTWLWLVHRERVERRIEGLERASQMMPGEAEALARARQLIRAPAQSTTGSTGDMLALVVRLTARIARELSAALDAAGWSEVALQGGGPADGDRSLFALADWRAVVVGQAGATFWLAPGGPAQPEALTAAITHDGPYAALRDGNLLVMPAPWTRSILRAVQFPGSDPVSFALLDGSSRARFPAVAGWSAHDWARRGVSEHAALLRMPRFSASADGGALSMLLTAARAALFLDSVERDAPALAVSPAAVVARLGEQEPACRDKAQAALDEYRAWVIDERSPQPHVVADFRSLIVGLPSYAAGGAPSVAG